MTINMYLLGFCYDNNDKFKTCKAYKFQSCRVDKEGAADCECYKGFQQKQNDDSKVDKMCTNINECIEDSPCLNTPGTKCIDYEGSYGCKCIGSKQWFNEKGCYCKFLLNNILYFLVNSSRFSSFLFVWRFFFYI